MKSGTTLTIVAAVNDENVLSRNLLRSPSITNGEVALKLFRGQKSASKAYHCGLRDATTDVVAFVHQDVYLPTTWLENAREVISILNSLDPNWAVLGSYGVKADGKHAGMVWSSGLNLLLGSRLNAPVPVESVDELVFIVRRNADPLFDPMLPDFHLYGTDVVQNAKVNGMVSYVAHLPVIHNSRAVRNLGAGYAMAYRYMQRKWAKQLPIPTTAVTVTRFGLPLLKTRIRMMMRHRFKFKRQAQSTLDPYEIAVRLGFEIG